ncbi:MAG TPA: SDR family oxidoreductase [Chloroflexia bacterium]|nr:SDR family oxidoreductase [Chloroflexia bacterium]
MQRIVVFGASGNVGQHLVREALNRTNIVTAFIRDKQKFNVSYPELRLTEGDVSDAGAVAEAIKGQDAVLAALGAGLNSNLDIIWLGLENIIKGMQQNGVRRIISVGSAGVLQADAQTLRRDALGYPTMFKGVSGAHLKAYEALRGSGLDWTFVCPPNMPEGDSTDNFKVQADYLPEGEGRITTGDVALFMLRELENGQYIQRRVGLTY